MRILIAEDDKVGRRILELFLKPYGECVGAEDGEDAVKKFEGAYKEGKPFELILLDVGMPKIEGIEVLKSIRDFEHINQATEGTAKIVMLTGHADGEKINEALDLGVSDYLIKPVEERKLLRELQRLGLIEDPDDAWS